VRWFLLCLAATGLLTGCGGGRSALSNRAAEKLLTASGRLHYVVHLDRAAYAVAAEVVQAEYVRRNCKGTAQLFGSIKAPHIPAFSIDMCGDALANQKDGNDAWFVAGSWRVVPNCAIGTGIFVDPDVTITTSECLEFRTVSESGTTYPWDKHQLQLIRRDGRWRVINDDDSGWSDGGRQLWPRRTSRVTPYRFQPCVSPLRARCGLSGKR
jgi:hypothetical protein